ncbi:hypothetical protein B0T26DRAFT_653360 [Lasiosphaeria miniovina]|uniref:Uncharacterized protein n=1 Tax=Lasiosphaeria miniovina TaxID=1954250 RepID=A0AA40DN32_9PEZI|nr:uncharacterized protein B0T26DRAFT_653360 [Lasiosphaeria miniovina]KAK0709235.1 hypothetical protein B0T26DRAFT_653360 [Lasiosphaeria miniovina]
MSCSDVLNLAAASRAFNYLIYHTPQVFRRLDLSNVKTAQLDIDGVGGIDRGGQVWRNVQMDENLSEDDFYSGPLRGIFSQLRRSNILQDVQILSLDGLSVTAELIHDIIASFPVRILSIRGAKNLNERKLCGALQYACRESRPEGTPRLKGLYVFGPEDWHVEALEMGEKRKHKVLAAASPEEASRRFALQKSPESWWGRRGPQFPKHTPVSSDWANTLVACAGVVAFDSVLCTGPRHLNSTAWGSVSITALNAASSSEAPSVPHYAVATHSLDGCASCGSAPEGFTVWGDEAFATKRCPDERRASGSASLETGQFPLLAPPPMHSANLKVAMCPAGQQVKSRLPWAPMAKKEQARFMPRCGDCIRDRYCRGCHRWWCESCYLGPLAGGPISHPVSDPIPNTSGPRVSKSCWECGMNCPDCANFTQLSCRRCGGGYCLEHNEGSNLVSVCPSPFAQRR